jgi:hypothetical protein
MAGLVPAIHVFGLVTKKTWMPAPSAGMTIQLISFRSKAALNCRKVIFPSWPGRHTADLITFCFARNQQSERFRLTRVTRIFQLSAFSKIVFAAPAPRDAYAGSCYFPVSSLILACSFAIAVAVSRLCAKGCAQGTCIFPVVYRRVSLDCGHDGRERLRLIT